MRSGEGGGIVGGVGKRVVVVEYGTGERRSGRFGAAVQSGRE